MKVVGVFAGMAASAQAYTAGLTEDQKDEILKMHNVYRCMHDTLGLQWSSELARTAQQTADKVQKSGEFPSHVDKGTTTFKSVNWLASYCKGSCPSEEKSPADVALKAIDDWYMVEKDNTGTHDGTVTHKCADPTTHAEDRCSEYSQMLWQTTTHVGCGLWQQVSHEPGMISWNVICHYGPAGNIQGEFEKNVLPLNPNKKANREGYRAPGYCKDQVKHLMNFERDVVGQQVIIAYRRKPKEVLAASLQSCDDPQEYRLVVHPKDKGLRLVPVAGHKSCVKWCSDDMLHQWSVQEKAVFNPVSSGGNQCLFSEWDDKLEANKWPSNGCTEINDEYKGHWNFKRSGRDGQFCMTDVPAADQGTKDTIKLSDGAVVMDRDENKCSHKWSMEIFNPATSILQSDLLQQATLRPKTCKDDCQKMGTFACALPSKCTLAPSEEFCTADGGEWCAGPAPEYPECADGKDDWGAREASAPEREECTAGCSFAICEEKMGKKDQSGEKLAQGHCTVKGQIRGCDYGSLANTCAFDDNHRCVYTAKDKLPPFVTV